MDKKNKLLIVGLSTIVLAAGAITVTGTFAWFTATAPSITPHSSTTTLTCVAPNQQYAVTKITVMGDTTEDVPAESYSADASASYAAQSSPNNIGNYEMILSESRPLTDVSGDSTQNSNPPVKLFKPVFASNYASNNVTTGHATIFDVSDTGRTPFSALSTGNAYPYVRFGFKIQNLTGVSKDVYPSYHLTESTGMHVARVSVCQMAVAEGNRNGTDFSTYAHGTWTEIAYLDTEGETVYPINLASKDPGYSFSVNAQGGIDVVGDPFSSYLDDPLEGGGKTATNASSETALPGIPITTLTANDYAFFVVTIWVEGQDPDAWSAESVEDNIAFTMKLY